MTELKLASRSKRLLGALIDSIICLLVSFPLFWFGGIFRRLEENPYLTFGEHFLLFMAGFAIFMAINGYFLAKDGQTVAKKLLGMRIVGLDGRLLPFPRLFIYRYLFLGLLGLIPFFGTFIGLLDALFIFRKDRRCLHDHLAGTIVIDV
ncbi:MAG: RDD family protein [Thermodesulfobacteria bacterium]|nr:RDD family protein [Thermodesulfobacteriota bacterium]